MRRTLLGLVVALLFVLGGRSWLIRHFRAETRRELDEDLPRSLRRWQDHADERARAGRRYEAYLSYKILSALEEGPLALPPSAEQRALPPRMRERDRADAERAEARLAEWLRREGEPLSTFLLLLVQDPRMPAGRRAILIRLLYRLCPERLRGPLLEMARRPFAPEEAVALWEASIYLGRLDGDEAAEALGGLVDRMENWGRQYAIIALKRMGRLEAVPAIERALGDSCDAVRRHACLALAILGDRKSIPPLEALLATEPDPLARRYAREAIEKIRGRSLP